MSDVLVEQVRAIQAAMVESAEACFSASELDHMRCVIREMPREMPGQPELGDLFFSSTNILSKQRKLFGGIWARTCGRFFLGPAAGPVAIKLIGHLTKEVLTSERPTRVGAGTQCLVGLVGKSVEKRFPIDVRLLSPPIHVEEAALVLTCDVGGRAGPAVIAGSRHHSRAHRVALHVRERPPEMVRRQDAGEEPVLPQMSRSSCAGVVILRVAPVDPPQEHAQGVLGGGHGDEVNVVGHQTPTQDAHAGVGQILLKESEIRLPVRVAGESLATVDSPLGDVARHSGQHATLPSWHNALEYGATI